MNKQIITAEQRANGKTRHEINAQSFRISQALRYNSPRWQRVSEITTRYLRAISCETLGHPNWTQMSERQCGKRYARAIYMQPKAPRRFGLTLNGYPIRHDLTRHELRLVWQSWPEHARRFHLHVTAN